MSFRIYYFPLIVALVLSGFLSSCKEKKQHASSKKLRVNLFCDPPSLDSRKATDSTSMNVLLMLFDGLTRIGDDHLPHPAVAEKIFISDDGCTYIFKLRESFWSNGDPVTAYDFDYTWKKILDPRFPSLFAYKLYVIANAIEIKTGKVPIDSLGVHAADERTLVVNLRNPTPYFLELVAFPTFYPVNRKVDQKNPEWAAEAGSKYVSNGPFKLSKWEHENEIVVTRNPRYWDSRSVLLNSIHLSMIDDTTTELYMYEMNELDWAGSPLSNLPPDFLPALIDEKKAYVSQATGVYYYKINTEQFPLNNANLRRALGFSISREAIVKHVLQGGQKIATSLVPAMNEQETPSSFFKDGDIARAQELFEKGLRETELTRESFPRIVLSYNTNREHQKIAQAIQQQWKEALGIQVELENFDWKVYLSKINKQDYQIARSGWIGDFNDPISFLEPFKRRDNPYIGGNNETGWEHPEYIALLESAEKERDEAKRMEFLKKAEELLIYEMPIIPIYNINHCYMKKPNVQGFYLSPLGMIDFKHAFIEKRP